MAGNLQYYVSLATVVEIFYDTQILKLKSLQTLHIDKPKLGLDIVGTIQQQSM